jgi:ATP-dependent helicase/nuclease subunit A
MNDVPDSKERLDALNIDESFIVQAPAGSGKTELLTQRYLRLLSVVKNPENIIAITFTRKAAGEMRERMIDALKNADKNPEPIASHAKQTWRLAKKALVQNDQMNWNLLQNPNRLRILTLDSLALMLAQQMPITSGFGAKPDIVEDAFSFYELAVERFITRGGDPDLNERIDRLLLNFDNQAELLKKMLVDLLSKREQWLFHTVPFLHDKQALKRHLELSLQAVNKDIIDQLLLAWPSSSLNEWASLLRFSLSNREENNWTDQLTFCLDNDLKHIPHWKALADLVLTQENTVRKCVTKNQGFPSKTGANTQEKLIRANYKNRVMEALEAISIDENLLLALATLKNAPPLQFDDSAWESLIDLLSLLPWLVAELNCIFQRTGQVDFNELTLGALRALGNSEQPTELAMKLDHQILHLLIDEFQDTSILQGNLIKQMIAEWQPNDGRSLFLVGDPMQSIYRFRNAEVSLFLQAQQQGIGSIPLRSIKLCANFRSEKTLIDWINPVFKALFPQTPQPSIGGVPYSAAIAMKNEESNLSGVRITSPKSSLQAESLEIIKTIERLRKKNPTESIAVLVRTRHQLTHLITYLKAANIPIKATEIDYLGERREIQDLLVLTRSLLHLGDRIAWLSLLRTPYFGFSLADCLAVAEEASGIAIWPALSRVKLSPEAKERLNTIYPLLHHALKYIRRCRLSNWIYQTWEALGGRYGLHSLNEFQNVRRFFDCLAEQEENYSNERFTRSLEKLFSEEQSSEENPVEIMTIHKSKGLEFDHVILPNINYGKPSQTHELMLWTTTTFSDGQNGFLLGILTPKKMKCGIYDYLRYLQEKQLDQEISRLFYVASTRAKKSLLLSHVSVSNKTKSGSFFKKLPAYIQQTFNEVDSNGPLNSLSRLRARCERIPLATFKSIIRPSHLPSIGSNASLSLHLPFIASLVGNVMHAYLRDLSKGFDWTFDELERTLLHAGLPKRFLSENLNRVQTQIQAIKKDPDAQWILSSHIDAKSEYSLSEITPKGVRQHIIDRTFIHNATRWIIDYKTSSPTGTSIEAFIEAELLHHKPQLKRYEALFSHHPEPVKSGLYFTSLPQWVILDC